MIDMFLSFVQMLSDIRFYVLPLLALGSFVMLLLVVFGTIRDEMKEDYGHLFHRRPRPWR